MAAGFVGDFAAALATGLALGFVAAGFVAVFEAACLTRVFSEDAFAAGAFAVDTEDFADFAFTVFAAVAFEIEVFEDILGAEDLPDLPDIALSTPYADVTFNVKLSSLIKQALF